MKRQNLFLPLLLCIFSIGCTTPQEKAEVLPSTLPEHVILVGFDGFSAYSFVTGADMPTLRSMMAEGAYTVENRSVLPSSSAVNWASMFMGSGPELHGYTEWGSQVPELPSRIVNSDNRYPNIYGLYRDNKPDAEIGFIYEWGGLNYLVDTLAFNYRQQAPMDDEHPYGCAPFAADYIRKMKPNLCAVIFDKPDGTGHTYGWESVEYNQMLTRLDECLSQIVKAVEDAGIMDETVIIVVSDHGGIDKGHGGKTLKEVQTPIVFYGKNVKKGHHITESTVIYDIGGTMAYLLGVEQPQVWTARPILSAFN